MSNGNGVKRSATSPRLSGKPPAYGDATRLMVGEGLEHMAPTFEAFEDSVRILDPATSLGVPKDASYSDPEVVNIWFESYGGVEPTMEFEAFVKGVATASFVVAQPQRERLIALVQSLTEHVIQTGDARPPAIDRQFEEPVMTCIEATFANNEATSWRRLLAFIEGAFWALGFVRDTSVRIGKGKTALTPTAWVHRLCEHYAQLGHLPT